MAISRPARAALADQPRAGQALPAIHLCPGHPTLLFSAPAGWTWRTRIGDYWNLWLALDGKGTVRVAGGAHDLVAGSVVVLPPGQEVEVTHDRRRPIRNFSAHFTVAEPGLGSTALIATQGSLLHDLRPLALQALHGAAGGDALGWDQATHLVSAMLCLIHRQAGHGSDSGPHAERTRRLAEEIRIHPERPWPLTRIASELGLSRAHAARCFRACTGLAPGRFVIRCRIDRAAHMLVDTDLPVGSIAGLLGYADVFYFSRHFTSITGHSPSRHRVTMRVGRLVPNEVTRENSDVPDPSH